MFLYCVHPGPDLTTCAMGSRRASQSPLFRLSWVALWKITGCSNGWWGGISGKSQRGQYHLFVLRASPSDSAAVTILIAVLQPQFLIVCVGNLGYQIISWWLSAKEWYNFTLRWCMTWPQSIPWRPIPAASLPGWCNASNTSGVQQEIQLLWTFSQYLATEREKSGSFLVV